MKGHGAKLPRKQEAAIAALMVNRSVEEAARSINVSPSTLRRWMDLADFRESYLKTRRDALTQAYARLHQNAGAAASVLLRLMADPTTKQSTRVQAAKCLLEMASKSLETEDVLVRLARLEKNTPEDPSGS